MKIPRNHPYYGSKSSSITSKLLHPRKALGGASGIVWVMVATLAVVFTLIGVFVALKYAGISNPLSSEGGGTTIINGQTVTVSTSAGACGNIYCGQLTVAVVAIASADMQTAVTLTSPTFTMYNSQGNSLFAVTKTGDLGSGVTGMLVGTSKSIQLNPKDNGKFFLYAYGGTGAFIDVNKIKSQSQVGVTEVRWSAVQGGTSPYSPLDITSDGKYDLLVTVDAAGVVVSSGQTPTVTLNIPVITDDSASITVTGPSDLTGQGTSSAAVTSQWKITTFTNKDGAAIGRIYMTSAQVSTLFVNPTTLAISGFQNIPSSTFSVTPTGSSSAGISNVWDFYNPAGASTQVAAAILVVTGVSTSTSLYFDVTFQRAMTSGSTTTLVLGIQFLTPAGSPVYLTDSMTVSA